MGLVFAFAAVGFAFTNCFSHQFALKCFRGAGFNQNRFRTLGPARKNDSKTKETQVKQRKRKQNKGNASKTKETQAKQRDEVNRGGGGRGLAGERAGICVFCFRALSNCFRCAFANEGLENTAFQDTIVES